MLKKQLQEQKPPNQAETETKEELISEMFPGWTREDVEATMNKYNMTAPQLKNYLDRKEKAK